MNVELCKFVLLLCRDLCRLLVDTHRVREGAFEDVVQLAGDLGDDPGKGHDFHFSHLQNVANLTFCWQEQHLKWPYRPVGYDGSKVLVRCDNTRLTRSGQLELGKGKKH